MDCRVICVSRSLGAGGEEVARLVAKSLGFRYVDDEIVSRAAEKAGVSPETVEKAERTPPLVVRILEAMAAAPPAEPSGAAVLPFLTQTSRGYQEVLEQVIRETAQASNVVIVAHGASIPLTGMAALLRVFVTASPDTRARRIGEERSLDERAARKELSELLGVKVHLLSGDGERTTRDLARRARPFAEDGWGDYEPLRGRLPIARIGHSIQVYQVEEPWW